MNQRGSGQSSKKRRKSHRRTLLACLTCRLRRVKCTLERPVCQNCCRLSLDCGGYDTKLKWLNYESRNGRGLSLNDENESDGQRGAGRREMFSVTERRLMSEHMIEYFMSLHHQQDLNYAVNIALESLDDENPDASSRSDDVSADDIVSTRMIGPFGVFGLQNVSVSSQQLTPLSSPPDPGISIPNGAGEEASHYLDDNILSAGSASLIPTIRGSTVENADETDFTEMALDLPDESPLTEAAGSTISTPVTLTDQIDIENRLSGRAASLGVARVGVIHTENFLASSLFSQSPDASFASTAPINPSQRTGGHMLDRSTDRHEPRPLSPPIDPATLSEVKMLLLHFEAHLSGLLSPCPLPGQNIRSQSCADGALQCYGSLSLLGDASPDACALLYSVLGMTAAHMGSVYAAGDLNKVNGSGRGRNTSNWESSSLRYTQLAHTMLQRVSGNSLLHQGAIMNVCAALLNLFTTAVMSTLYNPFPDILSRATSFLSDVSKSQTLSTGSSRRLLSLEYLLLQECILHGFLSLLSHDSSRLESSIGISLDRLDASAVWSHFLVPEAGGERAEPSISAQELHNRTGSPIPPSLLQLVFRNAILTRQVHEGGKELWLAEIGRLEEDICGWLSNFQEANDGASEASNDEDSISDDDSSSEGGSDSNRSQSHRPAGNTRQLVAMRLTHAYHTALLVAFFSRTRPSSTFLVRPLQKQLVDQLQGYLRAVDEAEVDVGVSGAMAWPLQVLMCLSPGKELRQRIKSLSEHVTGGGWKI